jgi:hypothetical protein
MRIWVRLSACLVLAACDHRTASQPEPTAEAPTAPTAEPPTGETASPNYAVCNGDLARLCTGITPGEGRLVQCLRENKEHVSEPCRALWKL